MYLVASSVTKRHPIRGRLAYYHVIYRQVLGQPRAAQAASLFEHDPGDVQIVGCGQPQTLDERARVHLTGERALEVTRTPAPDVVVYYNPFIRRVGPPGRIAHVNVV